MKAAESGKYVPNVHENEKRIFLTCIRTDGDEWQL